jgi:hypothetical protein
VVAGVALLRLEQLNDWVGKLFGIGAGYWVLAVQALLALAGLIALLYFRRSGRYPQSTAPAG